MGEQKGRRQAATLVKSLSALQKQNSFFCFFSQSLDLPAYRPTKSVQVRFESRLLLISLTVTRNSFSRWTLKRGPCIDFGENWSLEFSLYFGY